LIGFLIEQMGQLLCLVNPGAEHQPSHLLAVRAILLELADDVSHATRFSQFFKRVLNLPLVALRDTFG
jgi:hypothetical protein